MIKLLIWTLIMSLIFFWNKKDHHNKFDKFHFYKTGEYKAPKIEKKNDERTEN